MANKIYIGIAGWSYPDWKGIVYTALLFAAFHISPWGFLPIFGLGVLLGMITIRTNSTIPAMISHACNNAMAFTVAFLYRKTLAQFSYLEIIICFSKPRIILIL